MSEKKSNEFFYKDKDGKPQDKDLDGKIYSAWRGCTIRQLGRGLINAKPLSY